MARRCRMTCKMRQTALLIVVIFLLGVITYAMGNGDTFFGSSDESCMNSECPNSPKSHAHDSVTVSSVTHQHQEPEAEQTVNVIITFTKAEHNWQLVRKFTLTVRSLLEHATVPLAIHILGDERSQELASEIVSSQQHSTKYKMVPLDVHKLGKELDAIIQPMQDLFSYKPGAYYNHALFFMSIGIHRVMPETMHKVIMLDADLKFKADIKNLYAHFQQFQEGNIIGIGRDLQPVYRHTFWQYRKENPGTRVGAPPPDGLTGFNSGVLLLDLDRMRKSELYNSMLLRDSVSQLAKEFHFKGHLGDQDFFTLLSMKHENLFHVLPCTWNRQLCIWWKNNGYSDVFDQYYTCEGDVNIYHGNCNTPIPED